MLAVITPADGKKATVGNGVMVALDVGTPDAVKKVHAKAMKLGGQDEGQPGPRGTGGFHGGYFRDLDGNKLVAFCMAAQCALRITAAPRTKWTLVERKNIHAKSKRAHDLRNRDAAGLRLCRRNRQDQ